LKTVLLLATTTGYQIRSFGEAAEALGIRLVFASDRCDQLDSLCPVSSYCLRHSGRSAGAQFGRAELFNHFHRVA